MPQVCTVCKHPKRAEIDRSLVEGESLRAIAERCGTSTTSLHRHKRQHVPAGLSIARQAREIGEATSLLSHVELLIARLESIASKAENDKKWLAAASALREIGRCLRLLGELSGELSGSTINVSVHLQRSLTVVLGLGPEEFTRFFGTIFKQASQAQIHALLSAEETQDALCANPLFDSSFNEDTLQRAARESLTDQERAALEAINAKLQRFRDEHQAVKAGRNRIVLNQTEMAL